MAKTVHDLYTALEKHRKPEDNDDVYDIGRTTHCHLIYLDEAYSKKYPIFEVRGWKINKDQDKLRVSAVNWTITAGTCSLEFNKGNLDKWAILEDSPELQILYGR